MQLCVVSSSPPDEALQLTGSAGHPSSLVSSGTKLQALRAAHGGAPVADPPVPVLVVSLLFSAIGAAGSLLVSADGRLRGVLLALRLSVWGVCASAYTLRQRVLS